MTCFVIALAMPFASACRGKEIDVTETSFEPLVQGEVAPQVLYEFPGVAPGSVPIPESLERAERDIARATVLHDEGRYLEAASLFLAVAQRLRERGPYRRELAAMRSVAYRNAGLCYLESGDREAGWARLSALDDEAAGLQRAIVSLREAEPGD